MADMRRAAPPEAMKYLIHHTFLPPKLPGGNNSKAEHESILLNTVVDSLKAFRECVAHDLRDTLESVTVMTTNLCTIHGSSGIHGSVREGPFLNALQNLPNKGGTILLHIGDQNAGIIIGKVQDSIHVEAFELSPQNDAVVGTLGRLRRCFPGPAISLDMDTFQEPAFQDTISQTLAKMSSQRAAGTLPQVEKSGRMIDEGRDTTHPKLVTELFMGFLSAVGKPVGVPRIWKNIRDEVMWVDSLLPWRRSPLWMLVRVALQLSFTRAEAASETAPEPPMSVYKLFMLFHMARILDLSRTRREIRTEMLYIMNAKLTRRLLKLGPSFDAPGISFVRSVMSNTHLILQTKWSSTMCRTTPQVDLRPIEDLKFGNDTRASLPALDSFISSLSGRKRITASFNFNPTSSLAKYVPDDLPSSTEFSTRAFNLAGFEDWVATNLTSWIWIHKRDADTCEKLGRLVEDYHKTAQSLNSGNVEATSVMLLTVLELWIACDESATHICELLLDYYPGIPEGLFQSLILPFRHQMERLRRVEEYLSRRSSRARFRGQGIFKDFGTANSFPVRYFDQSQKHKDLLDVITISAARQRKEKCEELLRKKAKYDEFMRLYDQTECEYYEEARVHAAPQQRHRRNCRRCGYRSQASCLTIRVYEWPLPRSRTEQESAVFELKVPSSFGYWRDTTVLLLLNILKGDYLQRATPRSSHPLKKDAGLSPFFVTFRLAQRIGLLSQNKPHIVTHRRDVAISTASEDTVCLQNGLRYQYYDNNTGTFVNDVRFKDETPEACTYRLPQPSMSLQKFLFRPARNPGGLFPNDVIASQSNCPEHLSLDEYKALCNLPLGHLLQWKNILLQLFTPSVDFAKPETGLVILQAIHQAGPCRRGNALRDGHTILDHEQFALALLRGLGEGIQRMKENWESSQSLSTFVSLAARLLSLTTADKIKHLCIDYLSRVRTIAFDWVNLIREKAHTATKDDTRRDLNRKAVEIALICMDSFNVDHVQLSQILASPADASIFIRCGIIIQEGRSSVSAASNPMVTLLLRRQRLLSYRSYTVLSTEILEQSSSALDSAISQSWSAYQAGGTWETVPDHDDWLTREMDPTEGVKALCVHFNLLTSKLLVNGLPLDRLPPEYEQHAAYRMLFGNTTLEVMPTAARGMRFSGKESYAGYTLHFGLDPSPASGSRECDLLVGAVQGNRTYELVPRRVLQGEFPSAFIDKFVHWYSMTDQCVEFRPVQDPWTSSSDNWRLARAGTKWHLAKDGVSLIYVKSTTAEALSRILECLEDRFYVHTMLHRASSSIEIELPRIQLEFYMKQGAASIHSRQFRGMFIDPKQSLDTLIGLRSRLVLRSDQGSSRLVLVPEGCVSFIEDNDHVRVTIGKDSASRAHAYHIDGQLGRLVDNGSLTSKLFLCYLHALTASCIPDPLTRRTGTEQALSILNSAMVRSFDQLSPENLNLLDKIAHLTPKRRWYPDHERVMQSVAWSSGLSSLSQHGGFYEGVKSILAEARKAEIFHPDSGVQLPSLDITDAQLLERDNIRSSTFRVSGFGAEAHTISRDEPYSARDDDQGSTKCVKVLAVSRMVYEGRADLVCPIGVEFGEGLWRFLSQNPQAFGKSQPLPSSMFRYDSELLMDTANSIFRYWIPLHIYLSTAAPATDKFKVMIWLSTLSFAENVNQSIIQAVAAFFTVSAMMEISPPRAGVFQLEQGMCANKSDLRAMVQECAHDFGSSPEAKLLRDSGESISSFYSRRERLYAGNRDLAFDGFVDKLAAQWPCEVPATPAGRDCHTFRTYINVDKAMRIVKAKFKIWYDNLLFREYLDHIADQLAKLPSGSPEPRPVLFTKPEWNLERRRGFVRINDIFECAAPPLPAREKSQAPLPSSHPSSASASQSRLALLLTRLEQQANAGYEKSYVEDLRRSLLSLDGMGKESHLPSSSFNASDVLEHLNLCKAHVTETYLTMATAAMAMGRNPTHTSRPRYLAAASKIQQYPRLSPVFFLQQLARHRWKKISQDWQNCVVHYALALTELQQAERLAIAAGNDAELRKELRNVGHTNWDPFEHPETLLLEVESGIMIREPQEQIARQMRAPSCNQNVVMQLNMGEGKSSVIVPIVAAALADGTRLVRVIVAKPQSKQMFQMLLSKLGGLLDRRIYQVPFSRNLRFRAEDASAVGNICRECMKNGGIMLVQPEHILSFKLMGLESLISGKTKIGRALLSTQEFFDESSRDIVDESDENFSVKFELIYTMGMQRPVELSPDRWIVIHQVLSLVRMYAPDVLRELPFSIEVGQSQQGSFPRTRLLRQDAQELILGRVAKHICENGLEGFPIARRPGKVRKAVLTYMTQHDLTQAEIDRVEKRGPSGFWSDATKTPLLLLRGLMAGGILAFVFGQKRWRVNYGLDIHRRPATKLAVPYRAKDSPAPRSEFSHPDVVIVLTYLTYYYSGLEDEDLFLAFDHMMRSDQSEVEYQTWIKDAPDLPLTFHQLAGINLKDNFQCVDQVFPHLRFAKGVIDYFLSHTVFPKEMKEFPHKLSTSGWDIGRVKAHPTTGFSGTNDSRQVLPLGMKQLNLAEQSHTNALVLEYLLQPENSVSLMPPRDESAGSDAKVLLAMVTKLDPATRVILDVGAQILELRNIEVAEQWLKLMPDEGTKAVVFFNDADELSVLDREGRVEPLQTSSYSGQLDLCLVFLDEAHTRGTDLRLPDNYRAAATLGANLTKDRLVQACMRMRKLGKGQSVVFCVPQEVHTKIMALGSRSRGSDINVSDILNWAISETFVDTRRSMPLWAAQGRRFQHQSLLWDEARGSKEPGMSQEQAKKFLEEEARTLDQRYRPNSETGAALCGPSKPSSNPDPIVQRCSEFGNLHHAAANLQEEQERELAPEIDQERQVELPPACDAAEHYLHDDVIKFAATGALTNGSIAYRPAFETLRNTTAAAHVDVSQFGSDLLATADFALTVKISGSSYFSDAFQRPVQWILTSQGTDGTIKHMMIISPYEAQKLMPIMRKAKTTALHLYAPRSSLAFRALDALDLYTVTASTNSPIAAPSLRLAVQLNLFAGQLYLSSFAEYVQLCEYLGLAWEPTEETETDGFILRDNEPNGDGGGRGRAVCGFTTSPVKFLKVFMTKVRRNCEGIDKTHMGAVLDGRVLRAADFDKFREDGLTLRCGMV